MLVKIVTFQWNKMEIETSLLLKSALYLLILLVMVACSAPGELNDSEESVLIQRVSERWRCLERNDYACAYEFLSPAYREIFSVEMYRNRYLLNSDRVLTGVKVVAYDRGAAVASVRVGFMSGPLMDTPSASRGVAVTPQTFKEAWLQEKENWWYHENP